MKKQHILTLLALVLINITVNAQLSVSALATGVSCADVCDGSVTLTITNGIGPFDIYMTDGVSNDYFDTTVLSVITYNNICKANPLTIVVTDLFNGDITSTTAIVSGPSAIVLGLAPPFSNTPATCKDSCNGQIRTRFTGDAPLTYLWSNGLTGTVNSGQIIINNTLCADTYSVTITDVWGCNKAFTYTQAPYYIVNEPNYITTSFNVTSASCNNTCDGQITSTPSGGNAGGYFYNWEGNPAGDGTNTITGLCDDVYTVTITDTKGCIGIDSATVNEPTPILTTPSQNNVTCFGGNNGSISIAVSGGIAPYTYTWSPNVSTGNTASSLTAGTYNITITDNNGLGTCPVNLSINITQPDDIIPNKDSINILCFGGNTGQASVNPTGGTAPYSYLWNNFSVNDTIQNLSVGLYTVTITDFNNCTKTSTFNITQNPQINSNITSNNISCNGFTDGNATASPTGGVPPYTYLWSNGFTTSSINSLSAGTYYVTITDDVLCTRIDSAIIIEPSAFNSNFLQTNITCNGQNNGSASVTPSGGTSPYTVSWIQGGVPFSSDTNVTNLTAGNYTVNIFDNSGCPVVVNFTITQPSALVPGVTFNNNRCFGECLAQAQANPIGGNPGGYSYAWNDPSSSTSQSISNLCAGSYTVTVTDILNCSATQTITVLQPDSLEAGLSKINAECGLCNGQAWIDIVGGVPPYNVLWDNASSNDTITGLCVGYVSVTITDDSLCILTDSIEITTPLPINLNPNQVNIDCAGSSSGSASVSPTGGLPGYTYLWSTGSTSSSISGLAVGSYTVTVIDAQPCTLTYTFNITSNSAMTLSAVQDSASCANICDGGVSVSVLGGTAPYSYAWSSGGTGNIEAPLCIGSYTVTVTDFNNCATTASVSVDPKITILFGITIVKTDCNDSLCDGNATAVAAGGSSPYSFTWSSGVSTPINPTTSFVDSVCTGSLSVIAMDNSGCTGVDSVYMPADTNVLQFTLAETPISCFGANDGELSVLPSGGTSPYSYQWNTSINDTLNTISGLSPGTYSVTITDANLCQLDTTVVITQPDILDVSLTKSDVTCFGLNNGNIMSSVLGGTAPYSYLWSNTQTTSGIGGLTAGNYSLTVTDDRNCTDTASVIIIEPQAITNTFLNDSVSCNGQSDGSSTVNPTGGVGGYSFQWDINTFFQTTQTATNLSAGIYYITVSDTNGCFTIDSTEILQPNVLSANITSTAILCYGNSNGTLTANPTGGTAPYSYLWSLNTGSQTTQTAIGLGEGLYSVTVTDMNNCSVVSNQSLTEPDSISITLNISNIQCHGAGNGSIQALASGGTGGYTYQWSLSTGSQTTSTAVNLSPGSHSVTITDANGCTNSRSALIITPQPLQGSPFSTSSNCNLNDGTARVFPLFGGVPPYTHQWSTGATSIILTGLAGGVIYTDTITDANGCKLVVQVPVSEIGGPTNVSLLVTNNTCFESCDGAVLASGVTGGVPPYSYQWNDPANSTTPFVSGLCADTLLLLITDDSSCSYFSPPVIITQPDSIQSNPVISEASCSNANNGEITVNPSGGTMPYTFQWSNGANTSAITNLTTGTYVLTITDNNLCSVVDSIEVTEFLDINPLFTIGDINCFGDSTGFIQVSVTGGASPFTYEWDINTGYQTTANATDLMAGTYMLTITDNNGCSLDTFATILENSEITLFANATHTTCGNNTGEIAINALGGVPAYSYFWLHNGSSATNLNNLFAGVYSVEVTDNAGCKDTFNIIVNNSDGPIISKQINNVSCFGISDGSANINVSGGTSPYSYSWLPGGETTNTISGKPAGSYYVQVTDANGCSSFDTVIISEPLPISFNTITVEPICNNNNNGSILINAFQGVAPYTYLWSNGATSNFIDNLLAGTYGLTITDNVGCEVSSTVNLGQPNALMVSETKSNIACFGDNNGYATLNVTGGSIPYQYQWSNGSISSSITLLNPGDYYYTVTDANGCVFSDSIQITEPNPINVVSSTFNTFCGQCVGSINTIASGGVAPYIYSWSPGASVSGVISNLCAGTYTLTVTDQNNCSTISVFTINNADGPQVIVTDNTLNCFGDNNGTLTANVTGGTAPYLYNWNDPAFQTTQTANGLSAGSYQVLVTDNNQCTGIDVANINQPQEISLAYSTSDLDCNTTCDATATVNVLSGGVAPFDYLWPVSAGSQTSQTATNLCAGSYVVTVTDFTNCSKTVLVQVSESSTLTLTLSGTNISCNGDNNGNILASATGGNPTYLFNWSNGSSGAFINNLTPQTYIVTLTDQSGCQKIDSFSVIEPLLLSATISKNDISCFGIPNGTATAVVNGGTAPYQYNWQPSGSTMSAANNLSAGYQYITITDFNGCRYIDSTLIIEPDPIQINITQVQPNCLASNGSITITPSGGSSPYSYTWSPIANNDSTLENITSGTYTVTVTDASGCNADFSIALSNSDGPDIVLTKSDVTCGNTNDGFIQALVSGGTTPYSYLWSNGDTVDLADTLLAGIYFLTVTDASGCISIASDTIINSNSLNVTASVQGISCNSTNDGQISLSVAGGTSPYNYSWLPGGQTTSSITNLIAGMYYVTVTDAGTCLYVDSFQITVSPPISITANIINNTCFGDATGEITVTVMGGNAPYVYSWSNGSTANVIDNVVAGIYQLSVTDAGLCSKDTTFELIQPSLIDVLSTEVQPNCNLSDGSISISPFGGNGTPYTYLWSNASTTNSVSSVAAGIYTVTVFDSLLCSEEFTYILNNANGPDVTLSIIPESCFGFNDGSATAIATGGTTPYEYLWSNGDTTNIADSLMAGVITVTVTDFSGCISISSDTIPSGSVLDVDVNILNISCFGGNTGTITLTPMGGVSPYTYIWAGLADTTNVLDSLSVGWYYFSVTDANGCSTQDSAEIINASPIGVIFSVDSIDCAGLTGNIYAVANGGNMPYLYNWSNGSISSDLLNVISDTYVLTVTDASGCSFDTLITLTEPDSIEVLYNLTLPTCNQNDGQIDVVVTGGTPTYSIVWGGAATGQFGTSAINLFADIYPVTITDSKNCIYTDNVVLNNISGPILTLDSIINVDCYGLINGAVYITASSVDTPLVYLWSNGDTSEDIFGLSAGTYSVSVTDTLGCIAMDIFEVTQPDTLLASIVSSDMSCFGVCDGYSVVEVTGGVSPYTYLWSDPLAQTSDSAFSLCATTYNVTITDANNCIINQNTVISEPLPITITVDFVQNAICSQSNEGVISVNVSGGTGSYVFNWNGPNGFVSTNEDLTTLYPGDYFLTVTDINNCTSTSDTVINADITVRIDSIIASDTNICENDVPISLTGYSSGTGVTYLWLLNGNTEGTTQSISVSPVVGISDYILQVSFSGCSDADTISISVEATPTADAGSASPIIDGLCRTIGGSPTGPTGSTYEWSPNIEISSTSESNPTVCPEASTIYYVTVTTANGCFATDSVNVIVFPQIDFIGGFSPNGDGNNDLWIINNLEDFPEVVVTIFNRWGQLLWESDPGYTNPWDGTYKGSLLPVGTYYYVIDLNRPEFPDPITGPLTIVR